MTQIKPLSSMETPRFADVATFFRLPVVKDLNKLDYCVQVYHGMEELLIGLELDMGQEKLEMHHHL